MSHAFRELLRKVGSGAHTSESLTRQEAQQAMRMMLLQEATPAQIGAFMIAHRIRRPTGEELAGMLDAYSDLSPRLQPIAASHPVLVFCNPYDGRSRTAPLNPLTVLILAAAGCPVLQHGGDRMPTKEGDPLVDFWQGLGVDWTLLALEEVQQVLSTTGIGFFYQPTHFPLAQGLVEYRDQIGKRPPLATMELMWNPYSGESHLISGFVHPPTEEMFKTAHALRGVTRFTTIKGLEGSCDLPRERTGIVGMGQPGLEAAAPFSFDRLLLHPIDYGFEGKNPPLESTRQVVEEMQAVLKGQPSELMQSAVWNGGFYLWRGGVCESIAAGLAEADRLLTQGKVLQKLQEVQLVTAPLQLAR